MKWKIWGKLFRSEDNISFYRKIRHWRKGNYLSIFLSIYLSTLSILSILFILSIYLSIYLYILALCSCIYVSYIWPNGWSNLSKSLGTPLSTPGVTCRALGYLRGDMPGPSAKCNSKRTGKRQFYLWLWITI